MTSSVPVAVGLFDKFGGATSCFAFSRAFVPRNYDVFAGLDVDKRSISVTFTDHQGLIRSLRMPYNVEHLVNHVRKHFSDQKVVFAYEAGPTGYGLYDGLEAQAYRCLNR